MSGSLNATLGNVVELRILSSFSPGWRGDRILALLRTGYRHKVMRLLQDEGLLSDERTELLLSRRHTGFSVHTTPETAVVAVGMGVEEGGWLPYGHPLVLAGLGGGRGKTGFGWSPRISRRWSASPATSCGRRSASSGWHGMGWGRCGTGASGATRTRS
jgi:hypothetical protein